MNSTFDQAGEMTELYPDAALRVLMVTARYLPSIGGTETHVHEVVQRLVAAGHDVTVLTVNHDGTLPVTAQDGGVRIIRMPGWPAPWRVFVRGVFPVVARGHWDIVHCQGYHTLVAPFAMLAAWRARIPYIVTFHSGGHSSRVRGALRGAQRFVLRPLLTRAQRLIAVSRFEASFFATQLRLSEERFVVIPNGATLPDMLPPSPIPSNDRLIVSVGRLERYKGHHCVIAALPQVLARYPDIRLRIIGSGPYEGALLRIAEEHGIADRVTIGAIPASERQEMAATLSGAALVVLLSEYESQGIAAMEAIALGRPVLVSDSSALHELVDRGLACGIPPHSGTADVAAVILSQLEHPLMPITLDLPTWEGCTAALTAVYRAVLEASLCEL